MLCEGADPAKEQIETIAEHTRQYITRSFKDGGFITFVALFDEMIIGMCGLSLFMLPPNDWCPSGKTGYIGNLYTLPAYRGSGIGTKLFSLTLDEAVRRDCGRILLHATEMGRPIYEKFGFSPSDTAMAFFPNRWNSKNPRPVTEC